MPTSTTLPSQTSPVYASDEDILVRAGGDYALLVPPWQIMATGTDGVFLTGTPWVLTSTAVNFATNGVQPNQVVWLTAPKTAFPGGGHLLAIDSVSGSSITLRRPHQDLGVGQPPGAGGVTSVAFSVPTLAQQIEEATYDIKRRFAIDDNTGTNVNRQSAWIYDQRELRIATVLTVLFDRYTQETRSERGDFVIKAQKIRQQLDDVLSRVQVRWGPFGNSAEPSTIFATKLAR
jgi:hypothetical protein